MKEVTLEGQDVTLLPLEINHVSVLFNAIDSSKIWEYLPCRMETQGDMAVHVQEAMQERDRNKAVPFVVFDKRTSKIVGMTRLQDISLEDRKLEIGYTWYPTEVWRTRVNTECKLLLLIASNH